MRGLVFVIDDDADHRAAAIDLIETAGHEVIGFADAAAALKALDEGADPGVVLTDLRMPGMDGFGLIDALNARDGDHPVVLMTAHGDISQAVRAIRDGAKDFLEKPYDAGHLLLVIERTLSARATRDELARLRDGAAGRILGESLGVRAIRDRITALAPLDVDLVVTGPTGSGKELVARAIHAGSNRREGRYVAVNCAALPEALFEAEMFGHAPGVFPGAAAEKPGKLELASGGTLVLDEIEAMPMQLQAKLLRAIQERALERLGENRLRPLDLRIVAISKADLKGMSYEGTFRADLFYRIAGAEITTLPLAEMVEDVPLLFAHFAARAAARQSLSPPEIDFGLRQALQRRPWPGNVHELKAAAERYALGIDAPTSASSRPVTGKTLAERVANFERREISAALERCRGNTERAAELLGLPRRTLNDKISRLGLKAE